MTLEELDLVPTDAASQTEESLPVAEERKSNTLNNQGYGMRKAFRALPLLVQTSSVTQYLVS